MINTSTIAESYLAGNSKDLYFNEGLYYAFQGKYFDAITRLDAELGQYNNLDEPELNSLHQFIKQAEFSVGDFELYYRMHKRAGRSIKSVIESDVSEITRNGAAYRLAKIYHQKQQPKDALKAIEVIKGDVPEKIKYDIDLLKAQILISNEKFDDAIKVLEKIQDINEVAGYAAYNLAIAYIGNGEEINGISQLDKVGQVNSDDDAVLAIKDKANLVLGYQLMQDKNIALAKKYFERIRLTGPFSNKALLGLGWANLADKKYQNALTPWSILVKRKSTDPSVQEALSGLPFSYGKLEAHGKAAVLYGNALEVYTQQIDRLDASIKSIREGNFLKAIVRKEFSIDEDWLINLRDLADTPETYYLMKLLASNDFQEALKNYFDLTQLKMKISHWNKNLDSYAELINKRKNYYTPLFPKVQDQFRALDSRMKLRVAQKSTVENRLDHMLVSPRPDYLTTASERLLLNRLFSLGDKINSEKNIENKKTQSRINRLKGFVKWNIETNYQDRFFKAHNNFKDLQQGFDDLEIVYRSFIRSRQTATQSYIGYDNTIHQLKIRIQDADEKINELIPRQGYLLEKMAVINLQEQRKHVEALQIKSRFALAESYDRAVKAQQGKELIKNININSGKDAKNITSDKNKGDVK